ncbi:MAG: homoserine kinase [Chloroflexi bacterium]|nr:homoserine kinase [Chloroflexota bacterium]
MSHFADLDGRWVAVEVPATSANLGAGYDCLAVALEIVDRVEVECLARPGAGVEVAVEGEGAGELPEDRGNAFVVALERGLAEVRGAGGEELGWRIQMRNRIPLARGLGSSAAATVGGLLAGAALGGGTLTTDRALALATELEGHPDNAAAALLGGFTIAAHGEAPGAAPTAIRFDIPRDLRAILFIPELRLATRDMRAALPEMVPLADAVANLQQVALGVAGLAAGDPRGLGHLTLDRLHEPYRATVYPQLPGLVAAARDAGALGACLSGAGSTIIAFADTLSVITRIEGALRAAAADLDLPGRVELVAPRSAGARVEQPFGA